MTASRFSSLTIRRTIRAAAIALGIGLTPAPAMSADGIGPDADKILRSMSSYLGGLPELSVQADIDIEIVDLEGQKLQLTSFATILLQRPGNLFISRQGAFADSELLFDGSDLTLYAKNMNTYLQTARPGGIDDAINAARIETGLDAPGADLFYSDSYPGLVSSAVSGAYLGTSYVNGIQCHYLAFRAPQVDWQLWVQTGDEPLPMKYIITSKWVTGAPQYSIRFRNWNTNPRLDPSQFKFSPPEGAERLTTMPVDAVGEPIMKGGER